MKLTSALKNQNGSAMVMALLASLVLTFAAMFAQQQAVATEKNLRHLRLRNLLTMREGLARTLLGQSSYYSCTGSGPTLSCDLDKTKLKEDLNLAIPGCENSEVTTCGIVVDEEAGAYVFTPGNADQDPTVQIRLIYNGTELGLAAVESTTTIAVGALASTGSNNAGIVSCTPGSPFLKKLGANGLPECGPISPERVCPEGTYLKSLDQQMRAECVAMTNAELSCAAGKYMTSYHWNGGSDYRTDCTENKLNPFIAWPRQ